jgi:hypothetical protein
MSQNFSGTTPLRAINETSDSLVPIFAPLNDESVTGNEPLLPIAACTGIGGNGGVWFSIPLFNTANPTALERQQQNRLAVSVGAAATQTFSYARDLGTSINNYDNEMGQIFAEFNTDSGSTAYDEIHINTTNHAGGTHVFVTFIIYG